MNATIRHAVTRDIPELLEMGRDFFASSGLSKLTEWDDASFASTVNTLASGSVPGRLLVVEQDYALVGMAASIIFPLYCNMNVRLGQEIFWWVAPEHRNGIGDTLLEELEKDALAQGAVLFMSAALAGLRDKAIARVYSRKGYVPSENTFIRRLS
jgi:hypothetical protein